MSIEGNECAVVFDTAFAMSRWINHYVIGSVRQEILMNEGVQWKKMSSVYMLSFTLTDEEKRLMQ